MTSSILQVESLRTALGTDSEPVRAVDGVSFHIEAGETLALLGESGCGKSMTALSIMRLLPPSGRIQEGRVRFMDTEILNISETDMRSIRGSGISMIFQEPMSSLNAVQKVGDQIGESLWTHQGLRGDKAREATVEMLRSVGIPSPERRVDEYPHQLSGGMKQRVMIAMALANEPELLIADEPTTALDVTIQAQVLDLIRSLQKERGMAVLLITHDLGVVAQMADRVALMYAGELIEVAEKQEFFDNPRHPYSRKLFDSLPSMGKRREELRVIKGAVPSLRSRFVGCRFAPRCEWVMDQCRSKDPQRVHFGRSEVSCHLYGDADTGTEVPLRNPAHVEEANTEPAGEASASKPLLNVSSLKVHFPIRAGVFKRTVGHVYAVDGVDLHIPQGRTLALVGESGCGKTTVGKGVLQLIPPTEGSVVFNGEELTRLTRSQLQPHRSDFQIIFQDPYASMNPRMLVGDIIKEGMRAQGIGSPQDQENRVEELLEQVGMSKDSAARYPHEFSGGQRQRICIARALAVNPELIVCDEPTSALDVSVQAQILNLLKRLQRDLALSYLFITHNISVVAYLAHEIAVMYLGRIVEHGSVEAVLNEPKHPYTQALLSAVPTIEGTGKPIVKLEGDIPSPVNPPSGCYFHPRCPKVMDRCHQQYPERYEERSGRYTYCHLYDAESQEQTPGC